MDRTFIERRTARRVEALIAIAERASGPRKVGALHDLATVHWRAAWRAFRQARLREALGHLGRAWAVGAELSGGWMNDDMALF